MGASGSTDQICTGGSGGHGGTGGAGGYGGGGGGGPSVGVWSVLGTVRLHNVTETMGVGGAGGTSPGGGAAQGAQGLSTGTYP